MLKKYGQVVWENSGWPVVNRKADAPAAVAVPETVLVAAAVAVPETVLVAAAATDGDLPSGTNVPSGAAAAEPVRPSL